MKIGTVQQRLDKAKEYLQGERAWYALRTPALKERYAEHILRQAGFAAFVPVERRWVRVSRRARRRYRRPFQMIPRYVLVGFEGQPPWHKVGALRVTQGVVGWAKPFKRGSELIEPGPILIPHKVVAALIEVSREDPADSQAMPVGGYQTLQVGQQARVAEGPFASFPAFIAEIVGGDARIEVQIFGHATPAWIPLDALDPA